MIRGIAISFAVTQIPPNVRGNGVAAACASNARLEPRMLTREPGEISRELLARFTTPAAVKEGVWPVAAVKDTIVKPEMVIRYALLLLSVTMPRGSSCVWLLTPISNAAARGGHCRVPIGNPSCAGVMSITDSGKDTCCIICNVARLNRCKVWTGVCALAA